MNLPGTPRRCVRPGLVAGCLLLLVTAGCAPDRPREGPPRASAATPQTAPSRAATAVDTGHLETIEELTEGFANHLLDLSLAARGGRAGELAEHFAQSTRVSFPGDAGAAEPHWRWFEQRTWPTGRPERSLPAAEVGAELAGLLSHFRSREDVRFKVKQSQAFPPASAGEAARVEGRFKCWVVGRNRDGLLEWVRGKGRVSGVKDGETWRIDLFAFDELTSMIATRDVFQEVAEPAGVAYRDPSFVERGGTALQAHGAAAVDVDGDGLIDVFSTGLGRNFLHLNQGDGTFREVAASAGVSATPRPGQAPLFLDHDGDGDQDLFVTTIGEQVLFENRLVPEGRLFFRDVSAAAGVDRVAVGFTATAGDVDGNGWPDIYVASYNHYGQVMPDAWDGATNGTENLLFLNEGDGTFREAARELGVADTRWSYAATFGDVDGDHDLDLIVANDFGGPTGLFMNEDGRFVDRAEERGLAGTLGYGMGVSLGDYDNDGDLDLHVTKMSSTAGNRILSRIDAEELPGRSQLAALAAGNSLYRNLGDGRFQDVSAEAGPFGAGWAWGGGFLDVDGDGYEDLYTPNGFISGSSFKDT